MRSKIHTVDFDSWYSVLFYFNRECGGTVEGALVYILSILKLNNWCSILSEQVTHIL